MIRVLEKISNIFCLTCDVTGDLEQEIRFPRQIFQTNLTPFEFCKYDQWFRRSVVGGQYIAPSSQSSYEPYPSIRRWLTDRESERTPEARDPNPIGTPETRDHCAPTFLSRINSEWSWIIWSELA